MTKKEQKTAKKGKKKGGRKSKLNKKVMQAIISQIERGIDKKVAAHSVEINEATLYKWLTRGREDEINGVTSMYRKLASAMQKAEAKGEIRLNNRLDEIIFGGDDLSVSARALMFKLERRHPSRWGSKTVIDNRMMGPNGEPIGLVTTVSADLSKMSPEQLEALMLEEGEE